VLSASALSVRPASTVPACLAASVRPADCPGFTVVPALPLWACLLFITDEEPHVTAESDGR
jgi:hypothetical protein